MDPSNRPYDMGPELLRTSAKDQVNSSNHNNTSSSRSAMTDSQLARQQPNGLYANDNDANGTSNIKRVAYFSIDSSTIAAISSPTTNCPAPADLQKLQQQVQQQSSRANTPDFQSTIKEPAARAPCRLSQVDGNLCTHIILSPVYIEPQGHSILANDEQLLHLQDVDEFKQKYPHIRVLVSIRRGPIFEHQSGFQRAATNNEIRQKLARNVVEFLQKYNLDGLDVDWQFPNFPATLISGRECERTGLTKIMSSLRSAMVENFYARQTTQQHQLQKFSHSIASQQQKLVEPYLLTIAIACQDSVIRASYELKQLASLCDWLNIMSYDYFLFKAYTPFTGPISPLEPIVDPYVPHFGKLSFSCTVNRLLDEGIDGEKIVMGIPTYARAYRLIFRSTQPVSFSFAVGTKAGLLNDNHLSYREVSEILSRDDTIVEFDERARVPYLLTDQGYTWITYENAKSVREKVNYIMKAKLAGYMTWNLNNDDYLGNSLGSSANEDQTQQTATTEPIQNLSTFPLHRAMFNESTLTTDL